MKIQKGEYKFELVMVSGDGCSYCENSKAYLDNNELPYRIVDYKTFPKFKEDNHRTIPQFYLFNRETAEYELLCDQGYVGLTRLSRDAILARLRGWGHEL